MPVVYVPAQVRPPAHVENHVVVESGTDWDFSRSALVTPIVALSDRPASAVAPVAFATGDVVTGAQAARALAQATSLPVPALTMRAAAAQPAAAGEGALVGVSTAPVAQHPNATAVTLPLPVWTLRGGETISHGLEAWGHQAHWTVLWKLPQDWAVPATTTYTGSFEHASGEVLRTLSAEGVLLKGEVYEGNHTLLVVPTGEQE